MCVSGGEKIAHYEQFLKTVPKWQEVVQAQNIWVDGRHNFTCWTYISPLTAHNSPEGCFALSCLPYGWETGHMWRLSELSTSVSGRAEVWNQALCAFNHNPTLSFKLWYCRHLWGPRRSSKHKVPFISKKRALSSKSLPDWSKCLGFGLGVREDK